MNQPIVSIRNISKYFGKFAALDDVSLDIYPGEIFALLGPSGCGKSTLLRILSGFESPTSGELLLDGTDLTPLKPNKRPINMVFQSYAVFPHMSVAANVGYGLKMEGVPKQELNERVSEALQQVHLDEFARRMPNQLSGGQRQRVALARVLVKKPRLLLLDEPLSALDAKLRDAMRLELVKLQESVGITFVIVTHDQAEAMAIADRIAVLDHGRLRQVATPADLYQRPLDAFVANFVGNIHSFDVRAASIASNAGQNVLNIDAKLLGRQVLPISALSAGFLPDQPAIPASIAGVRPEHIRVSINKPHRSDIIIEGTLGDIAFQGQHSIVEIMIEGRESLTAIVQDKDVHHLHNAGKHATVWAHWQSSDMLLLPVDA